MTCASTSAAGVSPFRGHAVASLLGLIGVLFLGAAGTSHAEDDEGELPPEVERPEFLRNRPFIPDTLLKDKREGDYVTGVPAIGWDAENGFVIGAYLELYDNGSKTDPFFRTTPYRRKISLGGVITTEEVFRLLGRLDWPNIGSSPNRFRIDALAETAQNKNYFGVGDDGIRLRSPETGQTFRSFTSYQDDLDELIAGGTSNCPPGLTCTNARYNEFGAKDVTSVVSVERDMMGGLLRPLIGFQVRWVDVDDLTGERVEQVNGSHSGTQLPTRLRVNCDNGVAAECGGGWDNFVKLGLTYDSRDFAPNPTEGVLAEASGAFSFRALGSARSYQRLTISGTFYHDLLESLDTEQELIAALRGTYNMVFGTAPFFSLPRLGFNDFDREGLGGFLTLRGYKRQRLVGDSAALVNGELRWFFANWSLWDQDLAPGVAAFIDTGRAFDGVAFKFDEWQVGGGLGFRLAWNLATIVSFDLGASREDTIFYMKLGGQF